MDQSYEKKRGIVYRFRPIRIIAGQLFRPIRQPGQAIAFQSVTLSNEEIARRVAQLRYPELALFIWKVGTGLCNALGDETCMTSGVESQREICVELARAIVCLEGAFTHLSGLARLTRGNISVHEEKARPIQGRPMT